MSSLRRDFKSDIRIRDPKFLLVFPPLQFARDEMVRPDGTLALPYLDSSLCQAGFDSRILDMSIGASQDQLEDTFYRKTSVPPNFHRIGMSHKRILEEVEPYDIVAITSIFTQQTSRCFEVSRLIREHFPEKLLLAGGVNARSLKEHFFDNGFDVIFTSESEKAIVEFAKFIATGKPSLAEVPGIAFTSGGKTIVNPAWTVVKDLDEIPMPSWEKLPNDKYWEIGRLWGGRDGWVDHDGVARYAAIFTSRGCPFTCTYCHISKETGSETGEIGQLRLHSIDRVEQELVKLRSLGVNYIYVNDDTFLAKKKRVALILERMKKFDFKLADVNGINIVHFFKQHGGQLVVDEDLIAMLYEAGFRKISLPFESGNQRIIDKYAGGKWRLDKCDTLDLVKKLNASGIAADGNFMIGYPDETPEELANTFLLARDQMDSGMVGCQFFIVQPFPGTVLFEESLAQGYLSKSWHWDELGWSKGSVFENLKVDRDTLKFCWSLVWKLLNKGSRVKEFHSQLSQCREIEK